ncbi:MAG TPA: 1-acyl-sn-glycerol-3-phosphate acyltransferase [Bacteroidales bacterium]|nr:1-acyl-sn-glycerol-3-phosphate acyltransferase [Bacteroidales bacterium]HKM12780.1 1-acyl-sn-glycerol-3-phosphate acyltransferase [Bacteroidales bacterium]HPY22380.1 1-acyl-sn-glycerol-3-phosphate acyltransferase [Bacteroidales bacterium]HQA93429.1 1-acyl-sn-glycerol-3-phosphate acyltransferase [Bacteroidales bacterium]HQN24462.1 1-acyl-sn-glycerol-3-phosphate acyltransferase [Bacteroidales bacterium]
MFEDIRPYNDRETVEALARVAGHPLTESISKYFYPDKERGYLGELLRSVTGTYDFQARVMYHVIGSVMKGTTDGVTFSGLEHFKSGKNRPFLLLSNHRDIVLDSAFIQFILEDHKLPLTEIAVGDNLIADSYIEDIIRSNRMIKVVRSENPREVYNSSQIFSQYIRSSASNIWLAHRNGRAKDGVDTTEQGLLKMLDMSGRGDFISNFAELNIMPVSISYEIETCGMEKALETWIRDNTGTYKKAPGEDTESILKGIKQPKGAVHISFCQPLTLKELKEANSFSRNEKFQYLASIIDKKILDGFRLYSSHYIAADILKCKDKFSENYTVAEKNDFKKYLEREMAGVPESVDSGAVMNNLLHIYANPVFRKYKC